MALCGDLWTDLDSFTGLGVDVLLWPVCVAWTAQEWHDDELEGYARQATLVAPDALLVNALAHSADYHYLGGAAHFHGGTVEVSQGFDGTTVRLAATL